VQRQNLLAITGYRLRNELSNLTVSPGIDTQIKDLLDQVVVWEKQLPALRRQLRRRSTAVSFAPPHLKMRAFGDPQVFLDNKEITSTEWQSTAARDVLFCLLAHPEGLTGEGLGGHFWPDKSPPKLKLHLKKTLYRLRRALQQNVVIFQHNRYVFNFSLDYEYDVEEFWQNIAEAQHAASIVDQVDAYSKAVKIYRGSYLPGVDGLWVIGEREKLWQAFRQAALFLATYYLNTSALKTALSYCDRVLIYRGSYLPGVDGLWVIGEREKLWQAFRQAALFLATYYLNTSALKTALSYCDRVLDFDPCTEEAYVIAMRIYALQGHNAKVALQYERCKQRLHMEFGVQPSPQTQELFRQLTQRTNSP
jgi:two-component SAPR family response regulator